MSKKKDTSHNANKDCDERVDLSYSYPRQKWGYNNIVTEWGYNTW